MPGALKPGSRALLTLLLLLLLAPTRGAAQQKPPPTTADYGRWETLGRGAELSPDGRWLAYPVTRSNGENELRIASTTTDERTIAAFGQTPTFATDSRWLVFAIGQSEDETAELEKTGKPVRKQMGLVDLSTLEIEQVEGVAAFALSAC